MVRETTSTYSILVEMILIALAIQMGETCHRCDRVCDSGLPKICNYEFNVQWYSSMSVHCLDCPSNMEDCNNKQCIPLNGVRRPIITVNRHFPGPGIFVCAGDVINVKVSNNLVNGEGITIHWHGLSQRHSPYMDGTAFITQCPITTHTSFTYRFIAEAAGTYYWHGHVGLHHADGLLGLLVVRSQLMNEFHLKEYDFDLTDHSVTIMDWFDHGALIKYLENVHSDKDDYPDCFLINGKGQRASFVSSYDNETHHYTDREVFNVTKGKRYRFRIVVSTASSCPMRISVDCHNLTMIASDGIPFLPRDVEAFDITTGERYDFVLNANQDIGWYWLRVEGLNISCGGLEELAVIRYDGVELETWKLNSTNTTKPNCSKTNGLILNPWNASKSSNYIPITEVISLQPDRDGILDTDHVTKLYLGMDFNNITLNVHCETCMSKRANSSALYKTTPQINDISFKYAPGALLTQNREMDGSMFCEASASAERRTECENGNYCECIHVITADMNEIIELILIDKGQAVTTAHTMHLHGFHFRVLAMEKLGTSTSVEEVKALDKAGKITRNLKAPPLKDSVIVPSGGYTIIRFIANNPGWWFFHCHVQFHVEMGLNLVFHVGEDKNLPPIPQHFPRCYNWPRKLRRFN